MARLFLAGVVTALSVFPAWGSSFDDFNQGVNAFNRGDSEVAISALTRALASRDLAEGLKPAARIDRGIAYEREKRYADAITDLGAALASNPGRYDATYWRMLAFELSGQAKEAAADCDALLKLRPRAAALYAHCWRIEWDNGEFVKAVPYIETMARLETRPAAIDVLWLEITRLRAGVPDETEFEQFAKELNVDEWPSPVIELYLGKTTPEAVMAAAEESERATSVAGFLHIEPRTDISESRTASPQSRKCQATFFVGEWQLLHHNFAAAAPLLREADLSCKNWLPAKAEVRRLTLK